jgi:hypothetical protein
VIPRILPAQLPSLLPDFLQVSPFPEFFPSLNFDF